MTTDDNPPESVENHLNPQNDLLESDSELRHGKTIVLPDSWKNLLIWADRNGVRSELLLCIDATLLTERHWVVGSLRTIFESPSTAEILEKWAEESKVAGSIQRLATASHHDAHLLAEYKPAPSAIPVSRQLRRNIERYAVLGFLIARIPPGSVEQKEWFKSLKVWTLLHAMERAQQGVQMDANLIFVCSKLRLAADGAPNWLNLIHSLCCQSSFLGSIEYALVTRAKRFIATQKDILGSEAVRFLKALVFVANHKIVPSTIYDDLGAPHRFWQPPASLPDKSRTLTFQPPLIEEALGNDIAGYLISSDDGESDIAEIHVYNSNPPRVRRHQASGVILSAVEELQHLPWNWSQPNPPELSALLAALESQPHADPAREMASALLWLSIATGSSLYRCLCLPIGSPSSSEWSLVATGVEFRRYAPRRRGWKPEKQDAFSWITPAAGDHILRIPERFATIFSSRISLSINSTSIGELWDSNWLLSPEAEISKILSDLAPRITPGMLSNVLPQLLYERTKDAIFTRLMCAHPRTGLPGAAAYPAWTADDVTSKISTLSASLHIEISGSDENANALGSLLDVIDARTNQSLRRAAARLVRARTRSSPIVFHNFLTSYVTVALLAATGARPIRDPFESIQYFDFQIKFVFIADKISGLSRNGRLVPLPSELLNYLQHTYLPHLRRLADWIRPGAPKLAANIEYIANGNSSKLLPFLFLLGESNGEIEWYSLSETHITNLDLFDWPVPLRFFRHRLSTRLREKHADPEVIDGILGHAERGCATYGDSSTRVWSDDMEVMRPLLDSCFYELGFLPIRSWPISRRLPPFRLREVEKSKKPSFGSAARANERQKRLRNAITVAKRFIADAIGDRTLADLTEEDIDRLSRKLMFNENGIPHSMGMLRYDYLLKQMEKVWRKTGRIIQSKKFYMSLQDESSTVTDLAPGSSSSLAELRNTLKAVTPHLNHTSLGLAGCLQAAAFLLVMQSRVADKNILKDVLLGKNIRLTKFCNRLYLEHAPDLDPDDPDAATKRYRITKKTAQLLGRVMSRRRDVDAGNVAVLQELSQFVDSLARMGYCNEHDNAIKAVLALARIVDQENAMDRPGVIAGYLSGRLSSYAPTWRSWVRLRQGQPGQFESKRNNTANENEDGTSLLDLQKPTTSNETELRENARLLFEKLRTTISAHVDCRKSKDEAGLTRKELSRSIKREIKCFQGKAGRAVIALAHWSSWLVTCRVGRMPIRTTAVLRYLSAIAPAFTDEGYNIDLSLLTEDELTHFYTRVVLHGNKRRDYAFDRLAAFHRWYRTQFVIVEPDWSEIPSSGDGVPVAARIITEDEYLKAFASLLSNAPAKAKRIGKAAAFLLFLCYRFGLRSNEACGLLRSDWNQVGDFTVLTVQKNRVRDIKRPTTRRVVPLVFEITKQERELATWWLSGLKVLAHLEKDPPLFIGDDGKRISEKDIVLPCQEVIKLVTGDPSATLHNARHAAGNRVSLGVISLSLPGWKFLSGKPGGYDRNVEELLLHTAGSSRRQMRAVERYLGHVVGSTSTCGSYLHFLPEWADTFNDLGSDLAPGDLVPTGVVDLDLVPVYSPVLSSKSSIYQQRLKSLSPSEAVRFLRLLAYGMSITEASDILMLDHTAATDCIEFLCLVGGKVRLSLRREEILRRKVKSSQDHGNDDAVNMKIPYESLIDLLGRVTTDGWNRLSQCADTIKIRAFKTTNAWTLRWHDLADMIGASHQLLFWETYQASFLKKFLEAWRIDANHYKLYSTTTEEELVRIATNEGFCIDQRPRRPGGALMQLDSVSIGPRSNHRVTSRCAIVFRENDNKEIRNSVELVIAFAAHVLSAATNQSSIQASVPSRKI